MLLVFDVVRESPVFLPKGFPCFVKVGHRTCGQGGKQRSFFPSWKSPLLTLLVPTSWCGKTILLLIWGGDGRKRKTPGLFSE